MVYLDNAATSFPKPQETITALDNFVQHVGGNPGRSGHALSLDAARIIFEAREKLTHFIGGDSSERLIFTHNGTESLNLAILGLLRQGDHVVTTSMEHNSVMRPLSFLEKERRVEVSMARCSPEGILDVDHMKSLIKSNTRAVILIHGSNVVGTVQPVQEVRAAIGDVPLIVDACQTIGCHPIDVEKDGIDILCFSCHKSLFAIQGMGALYMKRPFDLTPLRFGGTGSKSESIEQPLVLPDRYESGTPNTPGIASLLGGLTFIEKTGPGRIIERESNLREMIVKGLSEIESVILYGPKDATSVSFSPAVSFNVANYLPSEIGYILNKEQIFARVGLQCAPMTHRTIGTFPHGTVRVSPGYFTSDQEIEFFLEVVRRIGRA
ncbi:MAG TPA: aminotransferase class V-fold PLP-dependent enzyme [Syntrophorhabdaceae bacterium]|nr:aminotransferase class V-fold PLP-dependent enzyme [Syntrophorhabdaceae bacterium]